VIERSKGSFEMDRFDGDDDESTVMMIEFDMKP
jgi:hypothetical protein